MTTQPPAEMLRQFDVIDVARLRLTYDGYGGCESWCDVLVERGTEAYVVTVTEEPDNPGTSVTNAAETIATEVAQRVMPGTVPVEDLWFVERYERPSETTLDRVRFTWDDDRRASEPRWTVLGAEGYAALRKEAGIR